MRANQFVGKSQHHASSNAKTEIEKSWRTGTLEITTTTRWRCNERILHENYRADNNNIRPYYTWEHGLDQVRAAPMRLSSGSANMRCSLDHHTRITHPRLASACHSRADIAFQVMSQISGRYAWRRWHPTHAHPKRIDIARKSVLCAQVLDHFTGLLSVSASHGTHNAFVPKKIPDIRLSILFIGLRGCCVTNGRCTMNTIC